MRQRQVKRCCPWCDCITLHIESPRQYQPGDGRVRWWCEHCLVESLTTEPEKTRGA